MITQATMERVPGLWRSMVVIAIIAAIPRFYWMLTGSYNAVIFIFIAFGLLPFIGLNKAVRRSMGFVRMPAAWIPASFAIGALAALVVYLIGYWLYGNSELNWFVAVMKTFDRDGLIEQVRPNVLLFFAFSLPVMIFSPIGEEFFFRGMLHESFAARFSPLTALLIDASFFGITHLAHYGLYMKGGSLIFLPSGLIWVFLMALSAILFYVMKRYSGSIWGAVICHSGFNFTMMAIIFYVIN